MGEGASLAWVEEQLRQDRPPLGQSRIAQAQQLQSVYAQQLLQQGLGNCFSAMAYLPGQNIYPQAFNTAGPTTEAEKTAEALLLRHLNDEQKASWEKHGGFWVTAAKSGNRYWLDGGRPRSMPQDGPPQSHCILADDGQGSYLPQCDQVLAQKLLIETDEEKFLATANNARL